MFSKEYRFKFYLNARHAVNINDTNLNIHPHTWEIVLTIKKSEEGYIHFAKIEDEIKQYLEKYEGQLLNEIAPFDTVIPLMENIGETFNHQIVKKLSNFGWDLSSLEISENPTRTFVLTNNIGLCEELDDVSDEKYVKDSEFQPGIEMNGSNNFDLKLKEKVKPKIDPDSEDLIAVKRMILSAGKIANIALRMENSENLILAAEEFASTAKKILRLEHNGNNSTDN